MKKVGSFYRLTAHNDGEEEEDVDEIGKEECTVRSSRGRNKKKS
mgnify:CR=1 FL=1